MRYHWTYSCLLLGYEILICFFLWHTIFHDFSSIDTPEARDIQIWKYLWLVPATFYVVWMYMFYSGQGSAVQKLVHPYYMLTILAIDLGSLIIYRVIRKFSPSDDVAPIPEYRTEHSADTASAP